MLGLGNKKGRKGGMKEERKETIIFQEAHSQPISKEQPWKSEF
jgi:hypothetical protein